MNFGKFLTDAANVLGGTGAVLLLVALGMAWYYLALTLRRLGKDN